MVLNGKKNNPLRLDDARALTPPVDAADALRRNLATVVFESIKTNDVQDIVGGLVKEAKEGDKKAASLILNLLTKVTPQATQPVATPEPRVQREIIERPVMVDSPATVALQKLIALSIHVNGTLSLSAMAALTGLPETDVPALLDSEWFVRTSKGISLTPAGRNAIA